MRGVGIFKANGPADLVSLAREFGELSAAASERMGRYRDYREENNAVRRPNAVPVSSTTDYGRKRRGAVDQPERHRIHLPLGKAMTVKHAYRIAGKLPDVVVDQRDSSKAEAHRSDVMEKIVWASIRASKGDTGLASAAWDASEVGSAVLDIYWDAAQKIPVFRRVDPAGIIEVQGVDDPHEFQRVYRSWEAPLSSVAAQYRDGNFRGERIRVEDLKASHQGLGGQEMVRMIQVCDQEKVTRFANGSENGEVVGLYEVTHNNGFVPYVVIPNIGPYEDVWGWADYEFVRSLVAYLPAMFGREADVLKAIANGGQIEKGTGQSPEAVAAIQREGGVLPSKRDGSVEPIQAPEMPSFHEQHTQRGMEMLKMLGFTPDAAWGLGSAGSGSDRGLQLQPLLEYTAMKQMNWSAGLSRMFGMAYRMIEKNLTSTATYRGSKPARGGNKAPFILTIGPGADDGVDFETDEFGMPIVQELPSTPSEIFDGDYEVRFSWRNRIDPDDPQYVMSELNKFTSGLQSMETTLANMGVQAPEDEMKRIEAEAKRFPWVNQGLVSMLMAQMKNGAQGEGGGPPVDQAGGFENAMETMMGGGGGESGALNADAGAGALPQGGGPLYGGA